jgi:negative regulator of sigma E activity
MKESVSTMLDGECSDQKLEQLLAEFEGDPAVREQYSRQVLAREAREGTRIRAAHLDFSSKVLAALQDEPAEPTVVVPLRNRVRRLPWRAAASLAAAAALGAVAVIVVRPMGPDAPGSLATQAAAIQAADIVPVAQPVETQFAELADEDAQQLRNYLMTYSQSRGQQGVGSTLGYARYAAYTDARPAVQPTAQPTATTAGIKKP